MPITRPSSAFSPQRISQSVPVQLDRRGLKFWLFTLSVMIAIVAVVLAVAFDTALQEHTKPQGGLIVDAVPKDGNQVLETESPKVSEYAKWMDGADTAFSKSESQQDTATLSKEVSDTDSPKVSEYAKWMDGADAALSESASVEPQQDIVASSARTHEDTSGNDARVQVASMRRGSTSSDGPFVWLLKQSQRRIMSAVKSVIRTEPYSAEAHRLAKSKLSESRQKEKELEKKLTATGDDNDDLLAYSSLSGKCISKQVAEYNYEACFFSNAKQGHVSLGTWKLWEEPHVGLFDDGSVCPGGPKRSLRVKMRCGRDEEIIDVAEPSRCTYEAIMTHPAACSDARLNAVFNASLGPRFPYVDVDEFW